MVIRKLTGGKMETGMILLFGVCAALLALAAWFWNNAHLVSETAVARELQQLKQENRDMKMLVESMNSTVANLSLRTQTYESKVADAVSQVQELQDHLQIISKDTIRIDRETARLRPKVLVQGFTPVTITEAPKPDKRKAQKARSH